MKGWLKGLLNSDKIIEETGSTVKSVVNVRTRYVRFAKIALTGLVVVFLGIGLIMAIKQGNKELVNKLLESIFEVL